MDATQLNTLLEVARTARDAATARLAQMQQQVNQARQHQQTLLAYADEYEARVRTQPGDTLDPAAQSNQRAFLAKLRRALEVQQREVTAREQVSAAALADLGVCQRKLKSLETLLARRLQEARLRASQREQRHTDEAAQRTAMRNSDSADGATAELHRL